MIFTLDFDGLHHPQLYTYPFCILLGFWIYSSVRNSHEFYVPLWSSSHTVLVHWSDLACIAKPRWLLLFIMVHVELQYRVLPNFTVGNSSSPDIGFLKTHDINQASHITVIGNSYWLKWSLKNLPVSNVVWKRNIKTIAILHTIPACRRLRLIVKEMVLVFAVLPQWTCVFPSIALGSSSNE